jgi:hypothetical protein
VTNPANWTKTYPGSAHVGKLPELPLHVGDTWEEAACPINSSSRPTRRASTPTTRPWRANWARLTPAHVLHDTSAMFCKPEGLSKGTGE